MTYRGLPDNVKERLSNYYEHRYQGKMFDEEQILCEISKPLKEVKVHLHVTTCKKQAWILESFTVFQFELKHRLTFSDKYRNNKTILTLPPTATKNRSIIE